MDASGTLLQVGVGEWVCNLSPFFPGSAAVRFPKQRVFRFSLASWPLTREPGFGITEAEAAPACSCRHEHTDFLD